jgi:hypothetical protein
MPPGLSIADGARDDRAIYAADPCAAPDSAFELGALRRLVAGRDGRLLDPRRTPVRVVALDLARGYFEVEVRAFEDAGAHWLVPLEAVSSYQFAPGEDAPADTVAAMIEAVQRLDRPLVVPADPVARPSTLRCLAEERAQASAWLRADGIGATELAPLVRSRRGDSRIWAALEAYLGAAGLAEIDAAFASTFVSNPKSGELVKGHAIVLAELGLASFEGTAIRDPDLFAAPATRAARARHILRRMGFVRALFDLALPANPEIHRGLHFPGPQAPARRVSFVSATFSRDVASANASVGGPVSKGELLRQALPVERLFMTFVEARAMNERFCEAEAVLVGGASAREAF